MTEEAAPYVVDAPPIAANTSDLRKMLRKRYESIEWVLLEEVASRNRYCDAVAVNLWQSRGYAIHGFEIKASRADWLRELKKPEKADESVFKYCDHWFIVAPKGIVKPDELPINWGLLEQRGASLHAVVPGKRLEAKPPSRELFANLVRRANEEIASRAAKMVDSQLDEQRRRSQQDIDEAVSRRTRDYQALKARVEEFEKATGMPLNEYRSPPIATVQLAQRLQTLNGFTRDKFLGHLTYIATLMEDTAAKMKAAVDAGLPEEA